MTRRRRPRDGDQVRHVSTGDVGTLHGFQKPWAEWALVRWDAGGPGMVDEHGLSWVAPGVLARVSP